jgi:hypothetical protein
MRSFSSNMIILNYFAGPGAGKSTAAAGTFHMLKKAGVNVELITEYAKDKTWEGNYTALKDQLYITAKQNYRVFRCQGKVDVVVTDSPILLGLAYYNGDVYDEFKALIVKMFGFQDNINIFIDRTKEYNPAGRKETEEKARDIDGEILTLLNDYGGGHYHVNSDEAAELGMKLVMERLPQSIFRRPRVIIRGFFRTALDFFNRKVIFSSCQTKEKEDQFQV